MRSIATLLSMPAPRPCADDLWPLLGGSGPAVLYASDKISATARKPPPAVGIDPSVFRNSGSSAGDAGEQDHG
jgi:hypothetical protein